MGRVDSNVYISSKFQSEKRKFKIFRYHPFFVVLTLETKAYFRPSVMENKYFCACSRNVVALQSCMNYRYKFIVVGIETASSWTNLFHNVVQCHLSAFSVRALREAVRELYYYRYHNYN